MWPFAPSPVKFAKIMTAAIRATGENRDITFNPTDFSLVIKGGSTFFMGNAYADYRKASLFERRQVIHGYIIAVLQNDSALPEFFEHARNNLLPRVRERAMFAMVGLRAQAEGQQFKLPPHQVFAEHLTLEVVFDTPESIATLSQESFDGWKVSWADALSIARATLRRKSREPFHPLGPGAWQSPSQDTHDASRMALSDETGRGRAGLVAVKDGP